MSGSYAISLNGIQAAERSLEQAAHKIATANLPASGEPLDYLSLTDYTAEFLAIDLAKTAVKANLKVISTRQEIEHETLDLFG
jgi:hypothetical protein